MQDVKVGMNTDKKRFGKCPSGVWFSQRGEAWACCTTLKEEQGLVEKQKNNKRREKLRCHDFADCKAEPERRFFSYMPGPSVSEYIPCSKTTELERARAGIEGEGAKKKNKSRICMTGDLEPLNLPIYLKTERVSRKRWTKRKIEEKSVNHSLYRQEPGIFLWYSQEPTRQSSSDFKFDRRSASTSDEIS